MKRLVGLVLVFLKIGFVFFGGGYVVIPIMHQELVKNLHWLTEKQFIDGTALSQLTPGPVAVLATFAGFQLSGISGALLATVSMYLPGSLLMFFLSQSYEKLRQRESALKVLNTLVPVVAGLLIATAWQIGQNAISGWGGLVLLIVSLVALLRFQLNPLILLSLAALLPFLKIG